MWLPPHSHNSPRTNHRLSMNIIFDYGNVLVRWSPKAVFKPYFNDDAKYWFFWRHVCDDDFRNRIDAGEDMASCIKQRQEQYPEYAEAIEMYSSRWVETLLGEMPGMSDLLQELKANPDIHIFGLTNWSMETFPQARKRFHILQLIDNYVVSGDVKLIKPDPRIFQLILQRFDLKAEETIFIDDNPNNVAAAQNLGIHGIAFQGAENLRNELFPTITTI